MAKVFESASSHLNPKLLARKMYLQQWPAHIFGAIVAGEFVKNSGREIVQPISPQGPTLTGAPIERFEQFVTEGRTDMDIPRRKRDTGRPKFGDDRLKGSGETPKVIYRQLPINYTRVAFKPPTGMSEQISRPYADQLITNMNERATQWLNSYWPGNLMCSYLAGYSYDLASPVALQGRGKGIVSHPNIWVAGSGPVAYTGGRPGTAGYEATLAADLDGLTDTAEDKMSVKLLRKLRVQANRAGGSGIMFATMKGGFKFRPMFISEAQWIQLSADPDYIDIMKRGQNMPLTDNPLINQASAYIEGFCIYVDDRLWGARTATDDSSVTHDVEYGPIPTAAERAAGHFIGNWVENVDQNPKKIGIILGASSLMLGVGSRLRFTEESDDHGFFKEFGLNYIQSFARSDEYDLDGMTGLTAGAFDYNDTSLAFATYSPYNLDPTA